MTDRQNILGLPDLSLIVISIGFAVSMPLMCIKLIRAPNIALKWADAQITATSSAAKLEDLTEKVNNQATIIKQKDVAYKKLELSYRNALSQGVEIPEVGEAIETIKHLPEIEDTEQIQQEISEIELDLLKISEVE